MVISRGRVLQIIYLVLVSLTPGGAIRADEAGAQPVPNGPGASRGTESSAVHPGYMVSLDELGWLGMPAVRAVPGRAAQPDAAEEPDAPPSSSEPNQPAPPPSSSEPNQPAPPPSPSEPNQPAPPVYEPPAGEAAGDSAILETMAAAIAAERPKLTPADRARLAGIIVDESESRGVDPWLVWAVIKVESDFNAGALGRAGERGLMQIMPATARWVAGKLGSAELAADPDRLLDPAVNVYLATAFLAGLLEQNGGNLERALTAYNTGKPDGAPNAYALKVLSRYRSVKNGPGKAG